ncbi:hypothetical protein NDU88_006717 [Pleurodeles waltl]|uniref:Uncharacterized protein n=1 Tax=Pleurodeles waltl TaxID=8319 RepID=A0AAV7NST7_PLEWA|nr:hypothetical protein NDU88_006717 [Pleurodeles waltl]
MSLPCGRAPCSSGPCSSGCGLRHQRGSSGPRPGPAGRRVLGGPVSAVGGAGSRRHRSASALKRAPLLFSVEPGRDAAWIRQPGAGYWTRKRDSTGRPGTFCAVGLGILGAAVACRAVGGGGWEVRAGCCVQPNVPSF